MEGPLGMDSTVFPDQKVLLYNVVLLCTLFICIPVGIRIYSLFMFVSFILISSSQETKHIAPS